MRIVFVAARYLPNRGGLETVVYEISEQMKQAGHTVSIITNRYPKRLPHHEQIDGTSVTRLHFLLPQLKYLKTRRLDLWLAGLVYFPFSLIELALILRRTRPDIVNIHYLGIPALFVWLIQRFFRFRVVVSLHGGDVDSEPYENHFNRWLFNAVAGRADQITACSNVLLNEALTLAPAIKSKAQTVHNGVNVAQFIDATPYSYPGRYVLGVGQLVKHKGFDLLIAAFAQVSAVWPEIDLLIAGSGPDREALDKQIRDLQLDSRIRLLGSVDHGQVAALMRGSLATVIPSRREPFGIVGLEALAAGRPVIASQIDGLVEALGDAEVRWFTSDSLSELGQALADILRQEAAQSSLSASMPNRANQERVRDQSWQKVAERYLSIFQMSVGQPRVRQS